MARLNNPFVVYGYKGAEYFCVMLLLVSFESTDRFQFHNLSLETMMKTVLWKVDIFRFA